MESLQPIMWIMFFLTLFQQTNASQWTVWECSATTRALVAQSCPTLCDPTDCSPPGSSVHGILQARILEWVAMPSSRGWRSRDESQDSRVAGRMLYHLSHQGSSDTTCYVISVCVLFLIHTPWKPSQSRAVNRVQNISRSLIQGGQTCHNLP